ncbi:unnamed protein product [Darwinula stevensoni]|uniref:Oplophorus-luciferin 2-monooxygenase non-catalytic subunit n=1 Tax=Darwinula stevensoni TaxID=69355 RepID=A0A7R8XHA7_9CRUS|nr:unnamed protein product [Darwinula stevensoni]CAG0892360.1 unnamed protein product [Darwinula stevensoni]
MSCIAMQSFLTLLLLSAVVRGQNPCPPYDEIAPCKCVYISITEVDIDCRFAATIDDVFHAFNNISWNFKNMRRFYLGLSEIEELPEGVFGDISFQEIRITDNGMLRSIHNTALRASRDRLRVLRMEGNHLNSFPFDILPEMTALTELTLYNNYLIFVPVINSDSLELLNLANNEITFLEEGPWSLPNLRELRLGGNLVREGLPLGLVSSMDSLVTFDCSWTQPNLLIPSGLLEFASDALQYVYLEGNDMSNLEPNAISGLTNVTYLSLYGNNIQEVNEDTFKPLLEDVAIQGNGSINLHANPLNCGCDMAWLVMNDTFREMVRGTCRKDGLLVSELDPQVFEELCFKRFLDF